LRREESWRNVQFKGMGFKPSVWDEYKKGMNMKAWIVTSLAAAGLAVAGAAAAADITVMTQNQYLGADIAPLVIPGADFNQEVLIALRQVAANKTTERLSALAAEISKNQPHLVGLQEVFEFVCVPFPAPYPDGCDSQNMDPEIAGAFNDHLGGTLAALGNKYYEVGQVTNLNISHWFDVYDLIPYVDESYDFQGVPVFPTGRPPFALKVRDRDVILARSDVWAAPFDDETVSAMCTAPNRRSDDGCNYQIVLPLPPGLGGNIERGYVAVQALVSNRPYVFVNTHLETRDPYPVVQAYQALELSLVINGLKASGANVVLSGDFNSSLNDDNPAPGLQSPYNQLTGFSGLSEAWLFRPGNVPGLSCCQQADLSNHNSQVYERIDLIWSSEVPWKVKDARVVGETVNFKTKPQGRGLWPSDHGAVVATLQFR
jgi:endonuclease/exonuclease/phosphatase family metal-dependent hydrolase